MSLEENIGYSFRNRNLLNQALTRKAFALEQKQHNKNFADQEIYCVLGDAVLKVVLVDLLIQNGLTTREAITTKKQKLEREERLAEIARQLSIGQFIKLGIGERKLQADSEPKVLAETLEAIIGAIYLDGGYDTAKAVITKWFKRLI